MAHAVRAVGQIVKIVVLLAVVEASSAGWPFWEAIPPERHWFLLLSDVIGSPFVGGIVTSMADWVPAIPTLPFTGLALRVPSGRLLAVGQGCVAVNWQGANGTAHPNG